MAHFHGDSSSFQTSNTQGRGRACFQDETESGEVSELNCNLIHSKPLAVGIDSRVKFHLKFNIL